MAQNQLSESSSPQDLISVMERQEKEDEAEAVALNGGVEPGTVIDYMREEVGSLHCTVREMNHIQVSSHTGLSSSNS